MPNEIEKKAIEIVMDYEKQQERNPKDVSKDKKEVGYDILSDDRKIEVKGLGTKNNKFVNFNNYNLEAFRKQKNFYLYIVYNIKTNNPRLIIFDNIKLIEKIKQSKFYFHLEIPLKDNDWDNGISV